MRRDWARVFFFAGASVALLGAAGPDSVARSEPLPVVTCIGETEKARAVETADARSIKLDDGRVLRLAGIEPFDFYLAGATSAKTDLQARTGALVAEQDLRFQLIGKEPDRYGRLSSLVLIGEEPVQETLAREGLVIAFATGPPLPCFDRILAAEDEARAARRGYWKDQSLPEAKPAALATRIGRFAIFEGWVVSVGNRTGRSYLNFGRRWTEDVTAEIGAADREAFGGEEKLAALARHRVRVRGFLEERGGPVLALKSPMQLEVLDAAKEPFGKPP